MLEKQFIQDYFNADFRDIDSLLNDVLVPIFGAFNPGYDEITLSRDAKEKAAQSRIKKIKHVATLPAMGMDIKVFDVTLDSRCHIHRARKGIQMLIRQYVEKFEGAFIVFHYEDPANRSWRFSYLEKRESNVASTNAKRYTYLCGKQYPCRTLAERFEGLQKQDLTAINLEKAFSVETLSDEFFNEYRNFYQDLVNFVKYEDNLIDGFVEYAKGDKELAEKYARDYIKKLMGRLVFIQFLQNKAWLKEDIHYTHTLFNSCTEEQKYDFLDNVLEPLFFGVFNTPKDARKALFHQEHWDMNLYNEWKDFPYLNGGLFECDELDKLSLPLPSYFFSNPGKEDKVRKPNDEYYSDACGIFDFFDRYNFTIDESDPLDREIGVDPEMLGKIFENLLEDNKDKGAFYTPKEIVNYMCKEALTAYLIDEARKKSEVNKQRQENFEDAIRAFVNDPEMTVKRIQQYDDKQLIDLDESLRDVKICDPAIGSGAFPMGLLNLLMDCRTAVNDALRKGEPRYLLKKEIIQNNIYGVDIEKGAIDIARLRFWLSIVVDLEEPEALPNFDYKFMQGNSLLEQFEGRDLSNMFETTIDTGKKGGKDTPLIIFDEESTQRAILSEKLTKYFASSTGVGKHKLRNEVNTAVRNLIAEKVSGNQEFMSKLDAIDVSANDKFFLWHTWFADVFNRPSKQGFDIVIGNPPYVAVRSGAISDPDKRMYKSSFQSATGQFDLYALFMELGINILKGYGVLTMITESTFVNNKDFAALRKLIVRENTLAVVAYLGEKVFTSASVDVTISSILKKRYCKDDRISICQSYENFLENDFISIHQHIFDSEENNFEIKVRSNLSDLALFEKMKEGRIRLGDIAELPRGAEFGANSDEIQNIKLNASYYPLLVGKDIKRYCINFAEKYIPFDRFNVSVYKEFWIYEQPKLFIQRIRNLSLKDRIVATYDQDGYICTNTLRMLYIKEESLKKEYPLKYILALLNSTLINYIFRTLFLNKDIYKYQLEQIPIPVVSNKEQQPIINLVDKILAAKQVDSKTDTSEWERQIDKLVYDLYGLDETERKLIEGE